MLVAFFLWWYGPGWKRQVAKAKDRLAGIADMFSIGLLLRTLFSPFRQISAGKVDGSLNTKMQAMVDRGFSRVIGAVMRSFMIILGAVALLLTCVIGGLVLLAWPLVPILPIVGIILSATGWMPWIV